MEENEHYGLGLALEKAIFDSSFSILYDYLETIVNFLDDERLKLSQSIDEIDQKIDAGEIQVSDDLQQMPPELEYEYYGLQRISEFENTLFSSFFVTIYFHLESELIRHCRTLEKQSRDKLLLSDIVGNGVQKAMTYLVKVQNIGFSLESNLEWKKIQSFNLLRNCIVHNQGRLDEGFSQREKLLAFIQRPNSKLGLENMWCVLNKDFCIDALDTIKSFIYAVVSAKTKAI